MVIYVDFKIFKKEMSKFKHPFTEKGLQTLFSFLEELEDPYEHVEAEFKNYTNDFSSLSSKINKLNLEEFKEYFTENFGYSYIPGKKLKEIKSD